MRIYCIGWREPYFPSCLLPKNAGFCSIVADMKPLRAAQRFAVELGGCGPGAFPLSAELPSAPTLRSSSTCIPWTSAPSPPLAAAPMEFSRARLTPNLSTSPRTIFSFLRRAPLPFFRLLCRTLPCWSWARESWSRSGRASARAPSVVLSFLPGRRRFIGFLPAPPLVFSIRDTNDACRICRLSFFVPDSESRSSGGATASGRGALRGLYGSPAARAASFERSDRRFVGTTGA